MAASHRASNVPWTAAIASHVMNFLDGCWIAVQERRKRTKLRAVLHGLSDRDLKDIGITRTEIEHFALNGSDERIDPRTDNGGQACQPPREASCRKKRSQTIATHE